MTIKMVGGKEAKRQIINMLEKTRKFSNEMRKLDVLPKTGVLLYGLEGVGKSLLATETVGEYAGRYSNVYVIELKARDYMFHNVGKTATSISDIFEKMIKDISKYNRQYIVIVHELDLLVPKRGSRRSIESTRTLTMLQQVGDWGWKYRGNIFIIGTTNRPFDIDRAFMRSGRVKAVELPIPNFEDRIELAELYLRNIGILDIIDVQEIAENTNGYVGADFPDLKTELFFFKKEKEEAGDMLNIGDIIHIIRNMAIGRDQELMKIAKFKTMYQKIECGESITEDLKKEAERRDKEKTKNGKEEDEPEFLKF